MQSWCWSYGKLQQYVICQVQRLLTIPMCAYPHDSCIDADASDCSCGKAVSKTNPSSEADPWRLCQSRTLHLPTWSWYSMCLSALVNIRCMHGCTVPTNTSYSDNYCSLTYTCLDRCTYNKLQNRIAQYCSKLQADLSNYSIQNQATVKYVPELTSVSTNLQRQLHLQQPPRRRSTRCRVDSFWML